MHPFEGRRSRFCGAAALGWMAARNIMSVIGLYQKYSAAETAAL